MSCVTTGAAHGTHLVVTSAAAHRITALSDDHLLHAACNRNATGKQLDALFTTVEPRPPRHILEALATNPHTSPHLLARIADATPAPPGGWHRHGTELLYLKHVATRLDTPTATLATLMTHTDPGIRQLVADNPHLPPDLLFAAATTDPDPSVRRYAAGNTRATPALLRAASTDPAWEVRAVVAYARDTPTDIVIRLAADTNSSVVTGIAMRSGLPEELILTLSKHRSYHVRAAIARNWSTPEHVLRRLAQSRVPAVALRAEETRPSRLHRYANTLPEPQRTHALLLIDAGFPGWSSDLATTMSTPPATDTTGTPRHCHSRARTR